MLGQVGTLFQEAPSEIRDQQIQLLQIQLSRHEINEEIVRFGAHLGTFKAVMALPDYEKGKKLDFITQELFREINTIGSKAINAEIGNFAISVKVELEKIREQLQNIL